MKYKRRKVKTSKHIRCDFEKKYPSKRKSILKRTAVSAIIISSIYAAGRYEFVDRAYIRDIISTDSPLLGEKITDFMENTAIEANSIYNHKDENSKPDNVYAKIKTDIPVKSDGKDDALPFNVLNPCAGRVSSPFGERVHPLSKEAKFHNGIDIASPEGNIVMACADGTVEFAGYNSSSGNYVIIDHANGYTSSYAHMQKLNCKSGDTVNKGDVIGFVGSTGISTGPHLHFEIRKNEVAVNPQEYIEG